MIKLIDKADCCGCNACSQICPRQCIVMQEDEQGFLYPKIYPESCINCGLCEKVCPELNAFLPTKFLHAYSCQNVNEKQRMNSSSGGVFVLLAETVLKAGGVVFGARFDKNWDVEHCSVERYEDLDNIMRSKYVQSRINFSYIEAEKFLKQGRCVLFVGTSCQVSGLHHYLRKGYDNLFTVDFICHGVPSPSVWRKYLQELNCTSFRFVNFRAKRGYGLSWRNFGLVIEDDNNVLLSEPHSENIYFRGFCADLFLRPSCYKCFAKSGKSGSDITIGDYWGVHTGTPKLDDNKGTSLVIVNSEKGDKFFNEIKSHLRFEQVRENDIKLANMSYFIPPKRPCKSIEFWNNFPTMSLRENIVNCTYIQPYQAFFNTILIYSKILADKILRKI